MSKTPPMIFSKTRRISRRARAIALQNRSDAARFILDDIAEDMMERLAFLRHEAEMALVVGDLTGGLSGYLRAQDVEVTSTDIVGPEPINLEQPHAQAQYDLILVTGLLDCVNDLPGALIHLRQALKPGGLVIATFPSAGSLPALRASMFAGDGDRPAARIHPLVDVRSGAELLQRVEWKDAVVDDREIAVSYRSLGRLVEDLREQGLGNVLTSRAPNLGKAAYKAASDAFIANADERGRMEENFTLITLSGRRSLQGI